MQIQKKISYQQGEFEGLCGVYAAINACDAILKLPWGANHFLYSLAVNELDRKGILAHSLLNGISLPTVRRLLYLFGKAIREFTEERLQYTQIANRNGNIKGIVGNIKKWLDREDSAVIIGIEGHGAHWTCISGYSSKTFILRDSDHRKILHLNRLTTGELGKDRIYKINPEEVIGIHLMIQ